jgi:hypothetical protein
VSLHCRQVPILRENENFRKLNLPLFCCIVTNAYFYFRYTNTVKIKSTAFASGYDYVRAGGITTGLADNQAFETSLLTASVWFCRSPPYLGSRLATARGGLSPVRGIGWSAQDPETLVEKVNVKPDLTTGLWFTLTVATGAQTSHP